MKGNSQNVSVGIVVLVCLAVFLTLPRTAYSQYASLSQASTVAKVFIAADINWSLGHGPLIIDGLNESEVQMRIDDWINMVRDIDTTVGVSLVSESEFWKDEFFVFSANPRMFHALPIVVAVSRSSLKVYRLSGFSESDFNDLISAHIQPIESRVEAAHLALFAEVVQNGQLSKGTSDSTVFRCSDHKEVKAGSVNVDTITSIIFNNSAPRDGYGEEDGKFIVHMYRVLVSQGVGNVHLVSYVIGSSGILDRAAIFWCNVDLNARQR